MNTNYAGFWMRFLAWIIDYIILSIVQWIIVMILAAIGLGVASNFNMSDLQNEENIAALVAVAVSAMAAVFFIRFIIELLYHSFLEASSLQGSIGKMALGLIVTDAQGQKLEFGKAFARNFCKIISSFTLLIGYIIAGFTDKKQALHDLIAGTLVVKKPTQPVQV